MKGLMTVTLSIGLALGMTACSSTRPTKEVDHTKKENKAMRHRNQATDLNNAGSQKDDIRKETN